ncbi:hypothetical protein VNO80_00186 [Phaseolus coccineus]|uniref:Uncharacterized protein n=1 Tax=Phaseolus coccineus TaxID=3886 RepID=A0AAN9NZK6_PHACN
MGEKIIRLIIGIEMLFLKAKYKQTKKITVAYSVALILTYSTYISHYVGRRMIVEARVRSRRFVLCSFRCRFGVQT